jgi:hypothetical protein
MCNEYQINPSVQVVWLAQIFSLALVLQADLQVPVRPRDEGAGVNLMNQFWPEFTARHFAEIWLLLAFKSKN